MGMIIYESSGSFSPSNYGLKVGDMLQIICVGGGGGGNGCAQYSSNESGTLFNLYDKSPGGNAGKAATPFSSLNGGGGAGYGGGGGGAKTVPSQPPSSGSYRGVVGDGKGGAAGEIKIATYKLTSLSSITVTVGTGGKGAQVENRNDTIGENGRSSSFGAIVTALGGVGGGANNSGSGYLGYKDNGYPSSTGGGGGGQGGYVIGGPLCHSPGGRGAVPDLHQTGTSQTGLTTSFTIIGESGVYTGGCGGGAKEISPNCIGGLPGRNGGPGSGVVIICW